MPSDSVFEGSVPRIYEEFLVPLIFQPYAVDLAARVAAIAPRNVLEVAAGSGVVTRALSTSLPPTSEITATDLNQAMIDQAMATLVNENITWRQADAQNLPFADNSFDVVVCQFAAMFFPDKARAFSEARRVLEPGGTYIFNVWDRIEENEFADVLTRALGEFFPEDPPRFLARTPHGYYDVSTIVQDLANGGWKSPKIETIAERSRAASARDVAIGYCQGSPLRDEIVARDASSLNEATDIVTRAIASRYGGGPVDAKIQAHIITVHKEQRT
jgi:ubiquinone/menaquinone biosynthesis C-methylase UbiE